MSQEAELGTEFAALIAFMDQAPLGETVSALEFGLQGRGADDVVAVIGEAGLSEAVLHAAMAARERFGKVSDVIHAAAIALVLPHILESGEKLDRPSLAAGNDPLRPFDVATDRRIAEFKLSRWDGGDGGRQRPLFKDVVHLLCDSTSRRPELYVLGDAPARWLWSTTVSAAWALRQYPKVADRFAERFDDLNVAISAFMQSHGSELVIVDLEQRFPDMFPPRTPAAPQHVAFAGSSKRGVLDFDRARLFIAAIPEGRWTAYKDVSIVAGSATGAQAIGDWLRRRGGEVPNVYRVLNVEGKVPDGFVSAGPGVPADTESVLDVLVSEGVRVDAGGRASPRQRFTHQDWKDGP